MPICRDAGVRPADTPSPSGQACSSAACTPGAAAELTCNGPSGCQMTSCSSPAPAEPAGLSSTFTRPVRKRNHFWATAVRLYPEDKTLTPSYPRVRLKLQTPEPVAMEEDAMEEDPVPASHPVETGAPSVRTSQSNQRPPRVKQLVGFDGTSVVLPFPELHPAAAQLQLQVAPKPAASLELVPVPTPCVVAPECPQSSKPLLSAARFEDVRLLQRDKNTGYWKTDLFFPGR